jgi:hypothetical protein
MTGQLFGFIIYVIEFIIYSFLISDRRTSKQDKLFFALIFGIGMIAPTSAIWGVSPVWK